MDTINLKDGETLLIGAKGIKGGKVQLEFAEKVNNPNARTSNALVGMLNKSDDRFSSKGARRAWISGEKADIKELVGIDVSNLNEGDTLDINKLNPELDGQRLRLQVTETVTPDAYQAENLETTAKRAGDGGDFITHKGMYIFSNTEVVLGEANHTFLESDSRSTSTTGGIKVEGAGIASVLEAVSPQNVAV
jgi:hypothetical protein